MRQVHAGWPGERIACVGAIVRDPRGRLLLVRRGTEPAKGLWAIPGGRVEPGESHHEAVVRELEEETALRIVPTGLAGVVDRTAPSGQVYEIEDFYASVAEGADPGAIRAGDDAAEVGWFSPDEMERLDCVEGLVEQLKSWRVLPGRLPTQRPASSCPVEA